MKKLILFVLIISFITVTYITVFRSEKEDKSNIMIDLSGYKEDKIKEYASENKLKLNIIYERSDEEGKFISQSIKKNERFNFNEELIVIFSKKNMEEEYKKYNVNELGNIPIMMYHNIYNMSNEETKYIGGNVDKDGYNRTKEAFINDLEMYYKNGYRMIRLKDYIEGNIDVKIGKSPIVLTFDDGNINNIKVIGEDEFGNIIIDPNSAVGIMESFKNKYKDYNITATFFLNDGLFHQPKYNEKILKWLVENGYDIGNHTYGHVDFSKIDGLKSQRAIALIYMKLKEMIEDLYVPIIALPYGSPYSTTHDNYKYIIKGFYEDFKYETMGILRVGWEPNVSPFSIFFNPLFMKRTRAYDNNGEYFDIEMVFNQLEKNKYISDGDVNTVVIKDSTALKENIDKKVIKY